MICRSCGFVFDDEDANFCPKCGSNNIIDNDKTVSLAGGKNNGDDSDKTVSLIKGGNGAVDIDKTVSLMGGINNLDKTVSSVRSAFPHDISKIWPEWQIEKQLGRGSYGVVYQVVRKDNANKLETRAAVKVISIPQDKSELDSLRSEGVTDEGSRTYFKGIVDGFIDEIKLMDLLKGNSNIVSIEDYKVIEKTDSVGWDIYVRMELLTSFNAYVLEHKMNESEVIKLGLHMCSALELCAEQNIIHRDIKPENIFYHKSHNFKLGDFGIARKLDNATNSLSQKGTYNYMAPEVASGSDYDATADIYSLGIVLYRLLNENRLPFLENESQVLNAEARKLAVNRRIKGEPLPAPCQASEEMAKLVLRACEFDPKRRFASAQEMKRALAEVQQISKKGGTVDLEQTKKQIKSAVERAENYAKAKNYAKALAEIEAFLKKYPDSDDLKKKQTEYSKKLTNTPKTNNDNSGKTKKIIIASAVAAAVAVGGVVVALSLKDSGPKPIVRDNQSEETSAAEESSQISSASPESSSASSQSSTSSSNRDTEIKTILDTAAKHAKSKDYGKALTEVKKGVKKYPDSKELKAKQTEYADLLADDVLSKAKAYGDKANYKKALEVIDNARDTYGDNTKYSKTYDKYETEYKKSVKATALKDAKTLEGKQDYAGAITTLRSAKSVLGEDREINEKISDYKLLFVRQVTKNTEDYLASGNIEGAKKAVDDGLKIIPDSPNLKTLKEEVNKYKREYIHSLSAMNANGFNWNEGVAEDPFGNSYAKVNNYAIFHGTNNNHTGSAEYSVEYKAAQKYDYFSFSLVPYSGCASTGEAYIRIYVDDVLRYTSPLIQQKTDPLKVRAVDISDAEYVRIEAYVDNGGCFMMYDASFNANPEYESKRDGSKVPLSSLKPFNDGFDWENEFPRDTRDTVYSNSNNYVTLHGENSRTYQAEYYLAGQYTSIDMNIAPAYDFKAGGSAYVTVIADNKVVYKSSKFTQKRGRDNTGKIDLTGAKYVKILVETKDGGCLLLSNVILEPEKQ